MRTTISWMVRTAVLVGSSALAVVACWGQTQTAPSPSQSSKVDPRINAPFQKGDVKGFIERFESKDREVYVKRREILKTLALKPGMSVADVAQGPACSLA